MMPVYPACHMLKHSLPLLGTSGNHLSDLRASPQRSIYGHGPRRPVVRHDEPEWERRTRSEDADVSTVTVRRRSGRCDL